MRPIYDEQAETFRREVLQFLEDTLPDRWSGIGSLAPEARAEFSIWWRGRLADQALLAVPWPEEYGGRGLRPIEQAVLQEEFNRVGVPFLPVPSDLSGIMLLAPTLLAWGTEEQKRHLLPRILKGDDRWCQGYSEPEAGSDLFALKSSARLDGDEWVVNGQKIWTSHAEKADWIFALVRTEPEIPRAGGISFLLIPMDQPGIEVRPISTMTGEQEFSEVFFTDAKTPADHILGRRGEGAKVSLTLLGFERSTASAGKHVLYELELARIVELAAQSGCLDDSTFRQRLGAAYAQIAAINCLGKKTLTKVAKNETPGEESSLLKMLESEYHQSSTQLAMDVLGAAGTRRSGAPGVGGMQAEPLGSPNSPHAWQTQYLMARAKTIYGGSAQIQRNTIAERVLGLPRN